MNKIHLAPILIAALLCGCSTADKPRDNLARFYQASASPIAGQVGSTAFVTKALGVTVYHGDPPMPYFVIGRFDRPIGMNRIAKASGFYGADFIYVDNVMHNVAISDPSAVVYGTNSKVLFSGKSHVEGRIGGNVYLCVTNLAHIRQ